MNLKPLPRVLNNGAHVLAYCEIDGHYLVLAWWARGEYISWWVNPEDGSAYAGQYSHEWSKACKAFEARRGGRGKGLQELIDEDSPTLVNHDGYAPSIQVYEEGKGCPVCDGSEPCDVCGFVG